MKNKTHFEEGVQCACCGEIVAKRNLEWLCQGCGARLVTDRTHETIIVGDNANIVTLKATEGFLGIVTTYEVV